MRNIKQSDFTELLYNNIVDIVCIVIRSINKRGTLNTNAVRDILYNINNQFTYCESFGEDNDYYYSTIVDKFDDFLCAVENAPERMTAENQKKWALYYVDALSNWGSFVRNGRKIENLRQLEG